MARPRLWTRDDAVVHLTGSAHAQYLFETNEADHLVREILRFLSAP